MAAFCGSRTALKDRTGKFVAGCLGDGHGCSMCRDIHGCGASVAMDSWTGKQCGEGSAGAVRVFGRNDQLYPGPY
jgi:hypothetical protein